MEKKQTAVQWLKERLPSLFLEDSGHYKELFNQALIMEKNQLIHAYGQGVADESGEIIDATKDAEQYYNTTYKSK